MEPGLLIRHGHAPHWCDSTFVQYPQQRQVCGLNGPSDLLLLPASSSRVWFSSSSNKGIALLCRDGTKETTSYIHAQYGAHFLDRAYLSCFTIARSIITPRGEQARADEDGIVFMAFMTVFDPSPRVRPRRIWRYIAATQIAGALRRFVAGLRQAREGEAANGW